MSMLSDQCDNLHRAARTYRTLGNHSAANMLEGAADTIWELRCKLNDEQDENERLRVSCSTGGEVVFVHDLRDENDRLQAENAKLRELVARLICHIENPPCESCIAEMSCAGGEGLTNCDEYQFMVCDARELGVEV